MTPIFTKNEKARASVILTSSVIARLSVFLSRLQCCVPVIWVSTMPKSELYRLRMRLSTVCQHSSVAVPIETDPVGTVSK